MYLIYRLPIYTCTILNLRSTTLRSTTVLLDNRRVALRRSRDKRNSFNRALSLLYARRELYMHVYTYTNMYEIEDIASREFDWSMNERLDMSVNQLGVVLIDSSGGYNKYLKDGMHGRCQELCSVRGCFHLLLWVWRSP